MQEIRTLIVDDEPLARQRIHELLASVKDIRIIAEAKNGEEARSIIERKKPDLIFLDIQMPGKNGFHVVKEMSLNYEPIVVIVSAYEKYAIKAFDIEATDYLLKPYDDERFALSLDRVRQKMEQRKSAHLQSKLIDLMSEVSPGRNYLREIEYKENGIEKKISCSEIMYFESEGNYIRCLREKNKNDLIRQTMSELSSRLDPELFCRIHRQFIVNRDYIRSYKYLTINHEFELSLYDGTLLKSSRTYYDSLCQFLNK